MPPSLGVITLTGKDPLHPAKVTMMPSTRWLSLGPDSSWGLSPPEQSGALSSTPASGGDLPGALTAALRQRVFPEHLFAKRVA